MRNSLMVTSDLKSMVVVDSQSDKSLSIGKRGVLLSVLGTDICASEVPTELDNHIKDLVKKNKSFFEFDVAQPEKHQLCISYNESSNTVFIIGIRDIDVGLSGPSNINADKATIFAVKLKDEAGSSISSNNVLLARLESSSAGKLGSKRFIKFYHLPAG